MALDALEVQLAAAVQRYNNLQRRADGHRDSAVLLGKTLAELGTALEEVRVAQEELVQSRTRMEQLQVELRQQYEKYWQLFDAMPEAYVVSKPNSTILEVNKAAAELFNVSQRFLVGKTLSVFVCEDRDRFLLASERAANDRTPFDLTIRLRPREKAPLQVHARVSGDDGSVRWVFRTVLPTGPSM